MGSVKLQVNIYINNISYHSIAIPIDPPTQYPKKLETVKSGKLVNTKVISETAKLSTKKLADVRNDLYLKKMK